MNFIDVTPEVLPMFAQAVEQNPNVKIMGTQTCGQYCRFMIWVDPAVYKGPSCQWTCEVSIDKGVVTTTFKPTP